MANRINRFLICCILAFATIAGGATREEVIGVAGGEPALKVIDAKCLVCHNRQRIDAAIKQKKDLEQITRQMEKKGVNLSPNEKEVLGTFWKTSPFRGKGE